MLSGIAHTRKKNRHLGSTSVGHHGLESGVTESQAPGVLLRVPIVPIFTAVVQKLLSQTSTASAQPISDSTTTGASKQKKKSKAQQAPVEAIQESNSPFPSMAVIDTVKASLELLCGPFMSEWFQPTLEQYTPLVQATLEAMVDLNRIKSLDAGTENILLDLGFVVLDRFRRLVVVQPNQKKVFTLLAGPMFEALVGARFSIRGVQGRSGKICQEAIGHILRSGLFHQEHLQEYTSGYNAPGGAKSLQSYQKQLFDHVEEMTKTSNSASGNESYARTDRPMYCYNVELTSFFYKPLQSWTSSQFFFLISSTKHVVSRGRWRAVDLIVASKVHARSSLNSSKLSTFLHKDSSQVWTRTLRIKPLLNSRISWRRSTVYSLLSWTSICTSPATTRRRTNMCS